MPLFLFCHHYLVFFYISSRCRWGLQVWQMREGVRVQVLQRQAPEVHTLRGPGRQEVPVSPLQQILREERQIKDPHFTRSRKAQASQGTEQGPYTADCYVFTSLHHALKLIGACWSLCGAERTAPYTVEMMLQVFIWPRKKANYLRPLVSGSHIA